MDQERKLEAEAFFFFLHKETKHFHPCGYKLKKILFGLKKTTS